MKPADFDLAAGAAPVALDVLDDGDDGRYLDLPAHDAAVKLLERRIARFLGPAWTPEALRAVFREVAFVGGLALWRPSFEVVRVEPRGAFGDAILCAVSIRVPERDDFHRYRVAGFESIIPDTSSATNRGTRLFSIPVYPRDWKALLATMRREIVRHVEHEVLESLLVAGVRIFDPHTSDPPPPAEGDG